ncbi:MAG TPA: hypothetical protein PLK94_13525 [Alphaproteobacteria bacterium]|nr:hypothetical protein [Alphaproteobacteria bacterium]HOO52299.1 hypothetical protein [Alphaproteobacteria bacterium]
MEDDVFAMLGNGYRHATTGISPHQEDDSFQLIEEGMKRKCPDNERPDPSKLPTPMPARG